MSKPSGLTLGRVVHFRPADGVLGGSTRLFAGRVSRVDDEETGSVSIHLDIPPPKKYSAPGRVFWVDHTSYDDGGRNMALAVVTWVPYDEGFAPGTWRFPPRV